jgi:hypothetical protein
LILPIFKQKTTENESEDTGSVFHRTWSSVQ